MVMDYSLLVGIDEARSELVTGIIGESFSTRSVFQPLPPFPGGVFLEQLDGSVRPASQNPFPSLNQQYQYTRLN